MTRNKLEFLKEELALLCRHFGVDAVRRMLDSIQGGEPSAAHPAPQGRKRGDSTRSVISTLSEMKDSDPRRFEALSTFYSQLRDRRVLPEAHDIRHFAQLVGLKDIRGKSRKDLIPPLIRFLGQGNFEQVRKAIESASEISEEQRQLGFSILTEKLVGREAS